MLDNRWSFQFALGQKLKRSFANLKYPQALDLAFGSVLILKGQAAAFHHRHMYVHMLIVRRGFSFQTWLDGFPMIAFYV